MADDSNVKDINVKMADNSATPELGGRRPYHIIMISDFGADGRMEKLTAVDKDDFARVLSAARPEIALAVKDPAGGADIEFKLAIDSLTAFTPAAIVKQSDAGRARLEIRAKIAERQSGSISVEALESAIRDAASRSPSLSWLVAAATPGAAPAAGSSAADDEPTSTGSSLLDMVDVPGQKNAVASEIERMAASVGNRDARVSGAEGGRLAAMIQKLDAELSGIAEAVLKHADFRRIETAWRGLKFLTDRFDFRAGPRLWALHAKRDDLIARFTEKVVNPVFEGDLPTPGLVLLDYTFVNKPNDVALLDEFAQHAAGMPVPAAFTLDAMFFNVKTYALTKNLPNMSSLMDDWAFAKWKSLRDKPYARSLLPVVGHFVLRPPYEASQTARSGSASASGSAAGFAFAEKATSPADLLWAGGHLAMAVCAARSYAKHGWPTRMFGAEAGKLEDLPVVTKPGAGPNDDPLGPSDFLLADPKAFEYPDAGINILRGVKGKDYCYLLGGLSAARPKKTQDISEQQAQLETSVPYQMFSNIIGAYLCEEQPKLHGVGEQQIQARLIFGLRDLMGLADKEAEDAVAIGVGPAPGDATKTVVAVRLSPPATIVPGGLSVEMGFAVSS